MTEQLDLDRDNALDALSRISASKGLQSSPLLQKILNYVVTEKLAGRGEHIKAYSIAIDVLNRPSSFDAQSDPVVRVDINRLRTAMELYYAVEGKDDPVRIDIPKGSYVPGFIRQTQSDSDKSTVELASLHNPTFNKIWWIFAAPVAGIVMLLALMVWYPKADNGPVQLHPHAPHVQIAVFRNISGRADLDNFAFGLSFDMVSELSRFSWLAVFVERERIASNAPAASSEPAGGDGRPDYILFGTIHVNNDQMVVSYRLSEARTDIVRWAKDFSRPLTAINIYDIQREAATAIAVDVGRPEGVIEQLEQTAHRNRTDSLSAYVCTLRIYRYWRTFSLQGHLKTRQCLETAVKSEPDYAEAHAALSFIYLDEHRYGTNKRQGYDPLQRSLKEATLAVELDPFSTLAKQALFTASLSNGNHSEFVRIGRSAVELAPNNPELLADFGNKLAIDLGQWDEGLHYSRHALRLNHDPAPWYFLSVAYRAIVDQDYRQALLLSEQMHSPEWFPYDLIRAISFSQLGDLQATRNVLDQMAATGIKDFNSAERKIAGWSAYKALKSVFIEKLKSAFEFAKGTS